MFAKKLRLPATTLLSHAQFFSTPLFSLKIQKNNLSYNRYGFVVSKKISKRAHIRNRSKRRVRAYVETLSSRLAPGYDMLFILKTSVTSQPSVVVQKDVEKALWKFLTQ